MKATLALMVVLAAGIGLIAGLRALPPSETEIIEAGAAAYVAETGGVETDCFGRPSSLGAVQIVVICMVDPEDAATAWAMGFDARGRMVEIDPAELDAEGAT